MTDLDITVTGLRELLVDLAKAERIQPAVRAVVQRGALNVKQDWARRWSGIAHAPALARAITYDTKETAGQVSAEIGPDKGRRQGALGNIIEFGTSKNAPIPGGMPALAAEGPRFEKALADVAEKALAGDG
ncbi:MAG: hypothetical protein M3N43_13385 [Actinomycetota bacterium]|nr:hypothetical protein [Actinomycetota bacterium]